MTYRIIFVFQNICYKNYLLIIEHQASSYLCLCFNSDLNIIKLFKIKRVGNSKVASGLQQT